MCILCQQIVNVKCVHWLWQCEENRNQREAEWRKDVMPQSMIDDITEMNDEEKTNLVMSGYGDAIILEWWEIYHCTLKYMNCIY